MTGLATLQSAVITHANAVLSGTPDPGRDLLGLSYRFGSHLAERQRAATPGAKSEVGGKRKRREKLPRDPNRPKRPLTPYFLYMEMARPVIAKDLGPAAKPGDVAAEGTRRWGEMSDEDKQVSAHGPRVVGRRRNADGGDPGQLWKTAYLKNWAEYQIKQAEYREGLAATDPSAAQLALENGMMAKLAAHEDGDDEHDDDGEEEQAEDDGDDHDATARSVRLPSPPPSKRQKPAKESSRTRSAAGRASAAKETPILPRSFPETEVLPPGMSPPSKKMPEKPRKRSERKSRGAEEAEKSKADKENKENKEKRGEKEKRVRRKRKSEAVVTDADDE